MLCTICRLIKPIIYTDDLGLHYCPNCVGSAPLPTEAKAMEFLYATIPFKVGDRVECRTGDEFDGIGVIDGVYFDIEHAATPVYPTFNVVLEEKSSEDIPGEGLYPENCLVKVADD